MLSHTLSSTAALSFSRFSNVRQALSIEELQKRAPAVFACDAAPECSPKYAFIPTRRVLMALMKAGFDPVEVQQARSRQEHITHAKHVVRLRRRVEDLVVDDAIPEVVFLNSHDGTSAYQFRLGAYRVACSNGLIASLGAFPAVYVPHRGDVVDRVVEAALSMTQHFGDLASQIARMRARSMFKDEQMQFATQALALRFADPANCGMASSALLTIRRAEDVGEDLWSVFNRVQENVLRGGIARRCASGRLVSLRRIRGIRDSVRINGALWNLASEVLVDRFRS